MVAENTTPKHPNTANRTAVSMATINSAPMNRKISAMTIIGQKRLRGCSRFPARSDCHRLVIRIGATISPSTVHGGMKFNRMAIDTIGSPNPTTPLTTPPVIRAPDMTASMNQSYPSMAGQLSG